MGFDDVVGNARVKKILRLALQKNRVPNSLLFCGPKGVGEKKMAFVLARAINCERETTDACEQCSTCVAISGRRLPDVWEIGPEGQEIKIDQMRAMKQAAYLRPMVARKRVFIVDEAEKMNEPASNSLLKILEEPPLFSHIILLTSNPHLILSTIKSRCQVLQFTPVGKEDIRKLLVEKGYPEEKARIISLVVRGNMEEALDTDWEEIQNKREEAWAFFLSLLGERGSSAFLNTYAFAQRRLIREDFEKTLEILSSFCRDLMLLKERGEPALLLNPDYGTKLRALEEAASLEKMWDCLSQAERVISGLDKNLNLGLLVSSFYSLMGD
ncbi:MAG: DNA polymerase III subunit delta' [Clostridiales bacterium]|nr:DNA polymerase III subunit delta' [Clostridiales bacterium]